MPENAWTEEANAELDDLSRADGCVKTMAFTDALGLALLEAIPARSRVSMRTFGDDKAQIVCSKIQAFLQDNGYDVVRVITRDAPAATKRIALKFGEYGIELIVAPGRPCSLSIGAKAPP